MLNHQRKKKQKAVTLRSTEYQWFSKSGLSGFEKKVEKRKKKKVRWSIRLKDLGICSCFGHLGFFLLCSDCWPFTFQICHENHMLHLCLFAWLGSAAFQIFGFMRIW